MSLNNVILAVEDRLSDAVATKILETFDVKIVKRIGFQGKSDLERKTPELNRAAKRTLDRISQGRNVSADP